MLDTCYCSVKLPTIVLFIYIYIYILGSITLHLKVIFYSSHCKYIIDSVYFYLKLLFEIIIWLEISTRKYAFGYEKLKKELKLII